MSANIELIAGELSQARTVLDDFCADPANIKMIAAAGDRIVEALRKGGKVMACGNGGSYCDAMHFAEELSGRYRKNRAALAAVAISDGAHITCVANDFGYNQIYARYVESVGKENDLLMVFSSSGNSENLIQASLQAKEKGIGIIALTGKDGGKIKSLADIEIRVPYMGWADRIQEIHIKIVHILLHYIETRMGLDGGVAEH